MAQEALSFPGLPNQLIQNPLWISMSSFIKSWKVVWPSEQVTAVRVQLELPNNRQYDLAVKYWPEKRTQESHVQVAAAGRATALLDHELLLPELFSCRVKGQGIVSISMYGGENLEALLNNGGSELVEMLSTIEEQEEFLKGLVAQLLVALDYMHAKEGHPGGAQCYRDLKPSNIVVDLETMKARLIDFGFMMRQDCSNFFSGISEDHFPVDYAAVDPETDAPYCCHEKSGYEKISLKVAAANAGSIDSNMVGITALRVLSFFTDTDLLPVKFEDAKSTADFAKDYWGYLSDQAALSELLSATGIGAEAVEVLLALLEVDPDKRASIKDAMSMSWVEDTVKEIKCQVASNRSMYRTEQTRYKQLPVALQRAAKQLSHHQQQQQLGERQQEGEEEEEEQLAATSHDLQLAQLEIKAKQQQVEQLQTEVLMLKAERHAASAGAAGQLQFAEEQLVGMMRVYEEQKELNELLHQQLLSQQQQLEQLLARVAQPMAAEEQQQQQSNKEEECDGLQQQSATSLSEVLPAEVGEKATDSRSTNSSLGGRSSSDLSAPDTPLCSNSSLTAAVLRPTMEMSSHAVNSSADGQNRTVAVAVTDVINSRIEPGNASLALDRSQATALAAVTDSSTAANRVIDSGILSSNTNTGSSSNLSEPLDTPLYSSGGTEPNNSSISAPALRPSMEMSNQAMSGDAGHQRTAVDATMDMTNSNTTSDNAASALGQHKAAVSIAASHALSHSLPVGDTAVREYRSTNNSLMHLFGVYLVDVGSWGDVTDGLISDAMLCYRWMRMAVTALTSFCF